MVKNSPVIQELQETWFDPWVRKIPWRRAWQPTLLFSPGESPWTQEAGGLQYMGSQRVGHDRAAKHRGVRELGRKGKAHREGI